MLKRLVLSACCCFGAAAHAADNGFYFGAGVGQSDFDLEGALDNEDTGYKLIAGLRLVDSFGIEINYADFGSASMPSGIACIALVGVDCPDTSYVDATSWSAFGVGFINLPFVDLFAKAGLSRVEADLRTPEVATFAYDDSTTGFAWGAGAQAHLGSFGARVEYEQFKGFSGRKLTMISLSLVYTLL